VKKLLKRKVNVNAADMHGVTPALALCHGFSREIEELNYHKVNSYRLSATVERQLETSGETLIAAFREIFALLVKRNADFTIKDKVRFVILSYAIQMLTYDHSSLGERLCIFWPELSLTYRIRLNNS
jgi:hypothetical protein